MRMGVIVLIFLLIIIGIEIPVFIRNRDESDLYVLVGCFLALGLMVSAYFLKGWN